MPNAPDDSNEYPELQGQVVPEVKTPEQKEGDQDGIGPNNENLNEKYPRVVQALRDMIEKIRTEAIVARRHEIRQIRQARFFWQGIQYAYWDSDKGDWQYPGTNTGLVNGESKETPRFQYCTNLYQGYGLSFISVISQDIPTVNFYPQSVQHSEDISTAKAASDVCELVEQNNHIAELLTSCGYYLWTDGKIGSYTRYEVDGEKFGYQNENDLEQGFTKMGEDSLICPNCAQESPVPDPNQLIPPTCPQCGEVLGPDNYKPADMVAVPQMKGVNKVPNGQEVISIIGGLELNTPVWAREQHEFPYLQWQLEVHKAKLRATYPHVASKLSTPTPGSAEDVYARSSRISLAQGLPYTNPGDTLRDLLTFLRTWVRPWMFYDVDDVDLRNQLLELFPDGCYIAFAGDVYCESRNEKLDDYWRVMHAMPGEGQNRPGIGTSMIPVQEQFNDYCNIQAEAYEFGIPPIYADPQVLDFDQIANQTAEPAAMCPARARPGMSMSDSFYQPAPAAIDSSMPKYMQWLQGDICQFLTGMFPAVFGGHQDGNDTASGMALARDQAMGRIGMVWRRLKTFYCDTMMLAVLKFRDNRPDDVHIPMLGQDNEYQEKIIRIADLRGNIQARPEDDETFPRLKSQQRQVLQQLMASEDPFIAQILGDAANLTLIKGIIGLTDFTIPGEDARIKQLQEIERLTGQAPQDDLQLLGGLVPSIPVGPLDFHDVELGECKRWASSEEGRLCRLNNPQGFLNVELHAQMHEQSIAQAAMAMMPPMAGPQGAGGAPPSSDNPPSAEAPEPNL